MGGKLIIPLLVFEDLTIPLNKYYDMYIYEILWIKESKFMRVCMLRGGFATSKHTILQEVGELRGIQVGMMAEMIDVGCRDKVASPDLTSALLLLLYERLHIPCWYYFVC